MHQDSRLRKITVEIPIEEAYKLTNNLHHGQLSLILRTFISSLIQNIEAEGKTPLYRWLDGETSFTLPTVEQTDGK